MSLSVVSLFLLVAACSAGESMSSVCLLYTSDAADE